MARKPRETRIDTRNARSKLQPQHEPYWRQIQPGLFLGYRKSTNGGVWYKRERVGEGYRKMRLGVADDDEDADGVNTLDFKQAVSRAFTAEFPREGHRAPRQEPAPGAESGFQMPVVRRFGPYTVNHALQEYVAYAGAETRSQRTILGSWTAHIERTIGKMPVEALTKDDIEQWKRKLAERPRRNRGKTIPIDPNDLEAVRKRKSSANRIFAVLRAALNRAWQDGKVPHRDAWARVKPFKNVDTPRVRLLTVEDCRKLIEAADHEFRPLVQAALYTGARWGELCGLDVSDFNAAAGTVTIMAAKSGQVRHVPLTEEGAAFFAEHTRNRRSDEPLFRRVNGERWKRSEQTRPMRAASHAAGMAPPVSFHLLRHAYGSLLAMNGVSLQVIRAALGHTTTRMTERHYAHLCQSYVAETIRSKLPGFTAQNGGQANGGPGAAE